ncbi:MAG: HAD-IIIC family phosphatase [Opitutaceae bacterium]
MSKEFKTLREALPLSLKADKAPNKQNLWIASSMESYYLDLFLKGYSLEMGKPVEIITTEFGNLGLSLAKHQPEEKTTDYLIILEWEDFLPGVSLRSGSSLLESVPPALDPEGFYAQLERFIRQSAANRIVLIPPCMATSPNALPESILQSFFAEVLSNLNQLASELPQLSLLQPNDLLQDLPQSSWTDSGLWIKMGWAYSLEVTSRLAYGAANTLHNPVVRKKLLITDLDDTLWHGLIGEEGASSVSWEPENSGYKHRIYQKFLNQLAAQGTLLAICSKNEESVAIAGLERSDLIVNSKSFVVKEIGWGRKSQAIERILKSLNIGAGDAVFIDDSQVECDEVQSSIPSIHTLNFPKDNKHLLSFIDQLKTFFPANALTDDDKRRVELYNAREIVANEASQSGDHTAFLEGLKMELQVERVNHQNCERPLQLINKTNQFNLNGIREDAGSWPSFYAEDSEVYQFRLIDRIADHGIIAVIAFNTSLEHCHIAHFVLSCRVFSRKIEHAVFDWLYNETQKKGCSTWSARFCKTERNQPVCNFLNTISSRDIANLSLDEIHELPLKMNVESHHSLKISLAKEPSK